MRIILFAILVSVFIIYAAADVRYRGNAVHEDYPGQCYYEELEQPIARGVTYKPIRRGYHCESIRCRDDYVLEIEYCGRHNLMPNETCTIDSDMNKVYPDCCPKLVCEEAPTENKI